MKRQIGILMAVFLLMMGIVLADSITLDTPADSTGVSGSSYLIGATVGGSIVNVTFQYKTATGSFVTIATVTNTTSAKQVKFNTTWDTTGITDACSISVNATSRAYNSTIVSDTNTGICFDNTNPTTSFGTTSPPDKDTYDNTTIIFTTATDASLVNCTLTTSPSFNSSVTTYFTQASGSKCTYKIDDINELDYSYYWVTKDGLNTSTGTSNTRYISVDFTEGSLGPVVAKEEAAKKADYNNLILAIVIITGVVVYLRRKK